MISPRRNLCLAAAALALSASAAHASTNNFIVPSFRGSASSEAGYWESFTVPFGAPGNLANIAGATTGAILTQVGSPSALITGTGNLYDPVNLTSFTLTDSTPYTLGTVVLQTRTLGSELVYGGVSLSYTDAAGSHTLPPLPRSELDRGTTLGASVSTLFQWDLTGLNVNEYTISFGAAGSSLSFDAMTLDTWNSFQVVPEPSTYALIGAGALLLGWRARRRKASA